MTHGTSPWQRNIVVGDIITVRKTLEMGRNTFMDKQLAIRPLGPRHNRHNKVNEGFIPIASDLLPSYLFIPSRHAPRTLFPTEILSPQTKLIVYNDHRTLSVYPIIVSKLFPEPKIVNLECVCWTN
jgi:hypothetical protein